MKSFFTVLFIFYLASSALAQSSYEKKLDSAINYDTQELNKKGIDTICIYKTYCVGCLLPIYASTDTVCRRQPYENNTYFFWKYQGVTWFTSKSYCFNYDSIAIKADTMWSFYNLVKNKIDTKEIKSAEVTAVVQGKKTKNYVSVDHDTHEDIFLLIGGSHKNLSLTEFPFQKTIDDSQNINYTYNCNTSIKKFQVLLDELVHTNNGKLKKLK
ncbi:MAG TPA: hypothetical protein VHE59_00075 [Mucilaginibacter sp.]|nr:hypothetical protein [Mucilaginibacter sp.]